MKLTTRKMITASALGLAFGGVAHAAAWIGPATGGEYSTAANWDDNLAPASNSTQDTNGAFTVGRTVDSTAGRTFVARDAYSTPQRISSFRERDSAAASLRVVRPLRRMAPTRKQ